MRVAVAAAALALVCAPAAAAQVQPYRTADPGGFRNILPSGQNGLLNPLQLAGYVASGTQPAHAGDQLRMYGDLVYASPGLGAADVGRYFKDASFGALTAERTYKPRADVTIVRDGEFGVPHIYGSTRAGAMFGAGYAGAEDRLFFMDVLRNAGRARLSSFAGGANAAMDREQWLNAPYTEADLQRQIDSYDDLYGADGRRIHEDGTNFVAGINQYIAEARLLPALKMPGEYAALGKVLGPESWKPTDVVATASLIGALFGKGGGRELDSALIREQAQRRFGRARGTRVWSDFRSADDPEAPTTTSRHFNYQAPPRRLARGSRALPDPGSVRKHSVVARRSSGRARGRGLLGGLLSFPSSGSNALLVSGRESVSGHPLAVTGPQSGYFNPQIFMEIDIHGPGIDARGASFAGVHLYVQLGRGRDYTFSATSAGQDIIDTFAIDLCEPGGRTPTSRSMHYRFRGRCLPIEVLERTNSWTPNLADSTPAGSETLRAERTKLGIVNARATVRGRPVAYVNLRSTYMHEVDSARGFADFNDPGKIRNARNFQRAAHKIGYTFNWLYADDRDIAYFNSGNNPVRAPRTDQSLPVTARHEWRDFDPDRLTARYTAFDRHAQAVNPGFLSSWNNKQAPGYRAADDQFGYGPIYRSLLLDDRIRRGIRGTRKMTLPGLIDAMEDAGTVDLRGDKVLPYALRLLGRPRDPRLRRAVDVLAAWVRSGAHRRDRNRDGVYEHTEAVRIMDAWWPRWIEAQFRPALGAPLFRSLVGIQALDNEPNNHGQHLGSAYQDGWYGYAQKDLRTVLGSRRLRGLRRAPRPAARYSRAYCGGNVRVGAVRVRGRFRNRASRRRAEARVRQAREARIRRSRCRAALADSLRRALDVPASRLYRPDPICDKQPALGPPDPTRKPADQWCFDSLRMRPLGAVEQPLLHWVNRPTFQQAVEVQGRAPR